MADSSAAGATISADAENNHTDPVVQVDSSSDNDSAYAESDLTDTSSLRSWIHEYRVENNRTYHVYGKHEYYGSNDDAALEHMEVTHFLYTKTFGGKLFLAPIDPNPQNILDIGTGTGSWVIDVADQFPSAQVVGTDLSPTQPEWVPSNCKFIIDDCEADFVWPENKFDYIHIRGLNGTIRDWPRLYQQCLRALRPGGYLEQAEFSASFHSQDNTLPPGGAIGVWNGLSDEVRDKLGANVTVYATMAKTIAEAGFVDVVELPFTWPVGMWPKKPELKELGKLVYWFIDTGAENWTLRMCTSGLGWRAEEVYTLCANMRQELRDRKVHTCQSMRVVYAQKPMS